FLYLLPEKIHVDIDDIRLGIEIDIPYIDGDIDPGDHLVLIPDKVFQELKFLGRQRYIPPLAGDLFAVQVHHQVRHFEDIGPRRGLMMETLEQGPDPYQQFLEIEGFYDIIVGAGLETLDLVLGGIHGGQHDDQDVLVIAADVTGQLITVHERQVDIQDRQIIRIVVKKLPPDEPVIGYIDLIVLFRQPLAERFRYLFLILNQ